MKFYQLVQHAINNMQQTLTGLGATHQQTHQSFSNPRINPSVVKFIHCCHQFGVVVDAAPFAQPTQSSPSSLSNCSSSAESSMVRLTFTSRITSLRS